MAIKHLPYPGLSDLDPSLGQITDFRALTGVGGNNIIFTSAVLLALFTTQIVLVPAFGPGTVLIGDEIKLQFVPGGTAYTINSAGKFSVNYTNLAGVQAIQCVTVGVVDQAVNPNTAYGLNVNVTNGHIPTPNAALVLGITGANLTVGNGTLATDLRYRIEPTIIH